MRNLISKTMLIALIIGLPGCKGNNDPSTWSESKTDKWFNNGKWRNNWQVIPDNTVNRKNFAVSYYKNRERWDKAFTFLRDNDLSLLEVKRYDIDNDNLYVTVSEYNTKNEEDAYFEAHRKYADIQYVANGNELIGIVPLASRDSLVQEYDGARDIEFFTVKESKTYPAGPENFFIFFPDDAHKPGLIVNTSEPVKKIVVKVRLD